MQILRIVTIAAVGEKLLTTYVKYHKPIFLFSLWDNYEHGARLRNPGLHRQYTIKHDV